MSYNLTLHTIVYRISVVAGPSPFPLHKAAMAAAIAKMRNKGGIAKTTKFKRSQSLSARAPKRQKLQPKEHQPYDHGFAKSTEPGSKASVDTAATAGAAGGGGGGVEADTAAAATAAAAAESEKKAKAEAEAKKARDAAAASAIAEPTNEEEDYTKERELIVYDDDF